MRLEMDDFRFQLSQQPFPTLERYIQGLWILMSDLLSQEGLRMHQVVPLFCGVPLPEVSSP